MADARLQKRVGTTCLPCNGPAHRAISSLSAKTTISLSTKL